MKDQFKALDPATQTRITKDNFFYNKCLERLVNSIAPTVLSELNDLEHDALLKRVSPAPKPAPGVRWSVERTQSGEWYLLSVGPSRDMGEGVFAPSGTMRFTGTPEAAKTFRFMGAAVPPEILEEYRHSSGKLEKTAAQQIHERLSADPASCAPLSPHSKY
jgi:hypothetical protein